jgi:hypothetical protein
MLRQARQTPDFIVNDLMEALSELWSRDPTGQSQHGHQEHLILRTAKLAFTKPLSLFSNGA